MGRLHPSKKACRAEFGEFDAIVGTPKRVYLIETKWGGSSECRDGKVALREEQTHRHDVFRWYRDRWNTENPKNWSDFLRNDDEFRNHFAGNKMAPWPSGLARNLQFV